MIVKKKTELQTKKKDHRHNSLNSKKEACRSQRQEKDDPTIEIETSNYLPNDTTKRTNEKRED